MLAQLIDGLAGPFACRALVQPLVHDASQTTCPARPLFARLLERVASPLTTGRAAWSHVGDLLSVAWDGPTIAVPASPANLTRYDRPTGGRTNQPPKSS
ncbi:hypothetical protein ACFXJ8_31875 [Nonomuraea sp. NPDC059194]|uniref:hypothetical protein n=1 Tax=Nonomuraea sp. NPDC059194 TaxID=3346764 RepID=UPI0036C1C630